MRSHGHIDDTPFPRGALYAAAALVALTILAATAGRLTGIGTTQMPEVDAVASRDLRFIDQSDGSVGVIDPRDGVEVARLAPGSNGFARGLLRGLARDRKAEGLEFDPPFRLTRWADGRLSIEDPLTGRRVDLGAFGPDNSAVFAQMFRSAKP